MATLFVVGGAVLAVLLGLALGALIVHRRASEPLVSLLRALWPLVLPLLAVIAVGAVQISLLAGLLVGTALGLAAFGLILRPESRQLRAVERWEGGLLCSFPKDAIVVAVPVALLSLGLASLVSTRFFDSVGGVTAFLLILALLLWAIALVLRLISYVFVTGAFSASLRGGVAAFLVLSGLYLGAAIGVLPFGSWLLGHAPCLRWALPLAAGVVLLLEMTRILLGGKPPAISRGGPLTQGFGLIAALLASAALGLSAVAGLLETAEPGEKLTTETAVEAAEEPSPTAPGRFQDDLALAKAYTPVLAFTRDERWTPISVDSYVREATLSGPLREPLTNPESASEKLDRDCPRLAGSPCYRLSIHCNDGHEPCGMGTPHPDRNGDRLYSEGDVYVRVVHKPAEEAEERKRETEHLRPSDRWPPSVFVDEGPYRESLTTLLQYWYFYRYDEWEASVFAGQLVQRHEGDWEAVTIGLSDRKPLFVGYSAHCGGTWRPWHAVELSDKFPEPTHPLVAVAVGSHANYPKADQKRTPDPAHCQGVPAGTTALLSYASNIRDTTEYGWQWYPAEGGWHLIDGNTLPMSFPGYWGADDTTTLVGFFKSTRLSEGHAPRTPSQQPLWESPVSKVFCGNYSGPSGNYHCKEG